MSFEIPGTTGQVLGVAATCMTVLVSFVWWLLMFTCLGSEGIGLMLAQIFIIRSAQTPTSQILKKKKKNQKPHIHVPHKIPSTMEIHSSIDMFLPWPSITAQRGLSFISEDLFIYLFICHLWHFSWLSLLIFVTYNRYTNMWTSSVKSTGKHSYLIENV